jgi:hypothetical protein
LFECERNGAIKQMNNFNRQGKLEKIIIGWYKI